MGKSIPCRKMFTRTIMELAEKDRDIVVITSDARGSVTLNEFLKKLPRQFFEMGIAEQSMVGAAAGFARCGLKPFVCAPACFLSARSFEQVKLDVAYTGTNVKLIGVSGGVSYGALGTSHHSVQDISMMRATAGMTVMLPCDIYETKKMTEALVQYEGPAYVRMGRGAVADVYENEDIPFEIGKAVTVMDGNDITLIGTGETVRPALDAAVLLKGKGIRARVLDMHTIKPLDVNAVLRSARETGRIITIEEHCIYGGLGGAVSEVLCQNEPVPLRILGIPDEQTVTGNSREVFEYYGLTAENICKTAQVLCGKREG
jgi:transketolase